MTKISEIKSGMKKLVVEGYITEKAEIRSVVGRYNGETYEVCDFLLSETKKATEQNSITMPLWQEDIAKFRVGDHVQIENGFATEFNEKVQLNVGKFGNIKLLV